TPCHFGGHDKFVQPVAFHLAVPDVVKSIFKDGFDFLDRQSSRAVYAFDKKIMYPEMLLPVRWLYFKRQLGHDPKPHPFKHRQNVGKRDGMAGAENLQPDLILRAVMRAVEIKR